jgi:hypothetical protein
VAAAEVLAAAHLVVDSVDLAAAEVSAVVALAEAGSISVQLTVFSVQL